MRHKLIRLRRRRRLGSHGYRTPDGVGCRVGDVDDVLALAGAPSTVNEVGGDMAIGNVECFAVELRVGLSGHRITAVFSRSRERCRSA